MGIINSIENDEVIGSRYCFTPDKESMSKLPRMKQERTGFICFKNEDQVPKLFGSPEGAATIIIDEYEAIVQPGVMYPTAKLIKAVKDEHVGK